MEKQIYGNITNTARTQFQFDRIYPNKREMNECKDSDGIYHGRYVLIEYGEDPARNATRLMERNGKFFYYDFPTIQVIPYGTLEDPATIAPGRLCYVVKDNTYIFYETYNNKAQPFKEAYRYNYNPATESINYNVNWSIDKDKYGRGYDSTVWQKVYIDNKEEYIMVAELNTVVPNFTMTLDAPGELPEAPHLEEESNLNYNLHMPAQWDFRVKQVPENGNSDEKAIQVVKYDENGNLLSPYKENEISADIFYNKDSFNPFYYDKVNIPESTEGQILYTPGKYYYKVYNVWGLRKEEREEDIAGFDSIPEFKKEKALSGVGKEKTQFYNESDTGNLESVELKKTTEINWSYSKENPYYRVSYRKYALDIENDTPFPGRQYYKQTYENSLLVYTPITFTKNEPYKKDTYYFLEESYIPDEETDTFKEDTVYYEKIGENEYQQIDLVYKPEYEKETYYTFCNQYYVKDYSATRDPKKTYYANIGDTEPVKFTVIYEPGVYYYLKEEGTYEEDPVYIIDLNAEFTPGRTYYNKIIPVLREGEDKISILPTGQSGRLYNTHIEGQAAEAAKDIQEISINFPSIGRMMFKIWNLVYGKQRRELIYGSPAYDPEMYDNEGNPLYEVGFGELNSLVAIINQVNDLIGHNMIKIDDVNSISIDVDKTIKINNKEMPFDLTTDNAENFIYWIESTNDFYRIKIKRVDGYYAYDLIPMSFMGEKINTINSSLLEIQKVLGTNESINEASPESIKGALLILQKIITDLSQGIDILAIGESLKSQKEIGYRGYDGTLYERDWSENVFVEASKYADTIYNDNKYIHNKYLTPYKIVPVITKVNKDNFNNYYSKQIYLERMISSSEDYDNLKDNLYIYSSAENQYKSVAKEEFNESFTYYEIEPQVPPIYVKLKRYDKNAVYFTFEKKNGEITQFPSNESEYKYINVLPGFFTRGANDERIYNDKLNIFEDIVEFYRYVIIHDDPKASFKDNTIYKLEEKNNFSTLDNLYVNKKGHIYSPEEKEFSVLPQTIITNEDLLKYLDVPVGTLVYTTTKKKKSKTIIKIENEDGRTVDENDITVFLSTPGYKDNIEYTGNNTIEIITLEGSIIKYNIKNNNHRYFAKSGEIKTEAGEENEEIIIKLFFDKKLKAPEVKKYEKLDTPIIEIKEKLDTPIIEIKKEE